MYLNYDILLLISFYVIDSNTFLEFCLINKMLFDLNKTTLNKKLVKYNNKQYEKYTNMKQDEIFIYKFHTNYIHINDNIIGIPINYNSILHNLNINNIFRIENITICLSCATIKYTKNIYPKISYYDCNCIQCDTKIRKLRNNCCLNYKLMNTIRGYAIIKRYSSNGNDIYNSESHWGNKFYSNMNACWIRNAKFKFLVDTIKLFHKYESKKESKCKSCNSSNNLVNELFCASCQMESIVNNTIYNTFFKLT